MIAKIVNGVVTKYPVNLQTEFLNISFPDDPSAILLPDGYVFVKDVSFPAYDGSLNRCIEVYPTIIDGVWTRTFEISALPIEQQVINQKIPASQARALRDNLLRKCDWTQVADSPLSVEEKATWAVYRQALRDVPSQIDFPYTIVWPAVPTTNE